jgi:hypothetical protein
MAKDNHPDKVINEAVKHARAHGWTITLSNGHAWGKMRCPHNSKDCSGGDHCQTSIWSTPGNPADHARRLKKIVDNCTGGTTSKEKKS